MSAGERFGGMDETCPVCGGVVGDHTLRSFTACMEAADEAERMPYREVNPEDKVFSVMQSVRDRFNIGGDVLVADGIQTSALMMAGQTGPMRIRSPAVQLDFKIGLQTGFATVAKVLYLMATPDEARRFGKLVRDASNGAANAAERAMNDKAWRPGGMKQNWGKK